MRPRGAMIAAALIVPFAIACAGQEAGSRPADVPEFSADTAFAYVRYQVQFGPRYPGSDGHARQLDWMLEHLRERADTVVLQTFTHFSSDGTEFELSNVFARFQPDARDRILLLAHWDTRPRADGERDPGRAQQAIDGANDGASGTAVLLEIANVLSRHSAPVGVDLLFVDGEDWSAVDLLIGSSYFAANLPAGYQPLYGILLDMVGDQDPVFPIEPNSQSMAPEIVDRVWRQAEDLGLGNIFVRRSGPALSDDHIPLNRVGIRTIDIIDFDYGPGNAYWHTLQDNLEHVSPRGLDAVGRVVTALIYRGG